jgi:hypothetical protein
MYMLVPRKRLFVSFDIIGSTALKQEVQEKGGDLSSKWIEILLNFYSLSLQYIQAEWQGKLKEHDGSRRAGDGVTRSRFKSFYPWKTIGDEILFVKGISTKADLYLAVGAARRAFRRLNAALPALYDGERPIAKCAMWTADFPVVNFEVLANRSVINELHSIFLRNPSNNGAAPNITTGERELLLTQLKWVREASPDPVAESLLAAIYLRSLCKISRDPAPFSRAIDFVGPSIDLGFQIARFSTDRRIMISLELARLLAHIEDAMVYKHPHPTINLSSDLFEKDFPIPFRYHGKEVLKGVWKGAPYPMFWIDASDDNSDRLQFETMSVAELEAHLQVSAIDRTGRKEHRPFVRAIRKVADSYLNGSGALRHPPFFPSGIDTGDAPAAYTEALNGLTRRVNKFTNTVVQPSLGEEELPDTATTVNSP